MPPFKRRDFIERSVMGAVSFVKESVQADAYAAQAGFLQSFDPRVRAAAVLFLMLQALFTGNIAVIASIYGLCLLLAASSGIRPGYFLKRTWIFIPLFSVLIAIPALFSVVSPGEPLASINIGPLTLLITRQGVNAAALFIMRVVTCVSCAVLLSLTTKHMQLLKVLRVFKAPKIFVMTLGMCYRYVYLFIVIIENTYLAVRSRVGRTIHRRKGQRVVAWNIAHLWERSYRLNEEVYNAMLARGYRGEPLMMDDMKLRGRDAVLLSAIIVFCALSVFVYLKTGLS